MKNAYDAIIKNIEGKVEDSIVSKKIKEVSSKVGRYV